MKLTYLAPLLAGALLVSCAKQPTNRQTISLNGTWEIAEGSMQTPPSSFASKVPVPGLVDMAEPPFAKVGEKDEPREAFWYRKTFRVDGAIPDTALLKISKSQYNTLVFLNGQKIGGNVSAFTPGLFAVGSALKGHGAENELLVRVGAYYMAMPKDRPDGFDNEKGRYIPGIYDSVDLILSGKPFIQNVQIAPAIAKNEARVVVELQGATGAVPLSYQLREAKSGKVVAEKQFTADTTPAGDIVKADFTVPIPDAHLWSPENPFLYTLNLSTGHDTQDTRFGMREFRFDPATGKAELNGKPYYLRGTNVCINRFFDDSQRGNLPWDEKWVRGLHEKFKDMGWNAMRYTIGFPPELWYRIADEMGFLIQDEYPLWYRPPDPKGGTKTSITVDALVDEYTRWMRERWNHPCVVIWDAQNESRNFLVSGQALQKVRSLDLSNRPWDNGWGDRQNPNDSLECHPYFFQVFFRNKVTGPVPNPPFKISDLKNETGMPRFVANLTQPKTNIIIDEYGWMWLNRDGSPTVMTKGIYQDGNIAFPVATAEQRQYAWARMLAAETEFWRAHRVVAGVMEFCSVSYSRPPVGQTSDHFRDVKNLVFEPNFADYVRDAFSPVGVMVNVWDETLPPGPRAVEIYLINDLEKEWKGDVTLSVLHDGKAISQTSQSATIAPIGQTILKMNATVPTEPGSYQLEAAINVPERGRVRSLRDFKVVAPAPAAAVPSAVK